jgi:hypothetical protein
MSWTIQLIGTIALLLTLAGVLTLVLGLLKSPPKPKRLPPGLRSVIVAIELARTGQEANDILGEADSAMRVYLRQGIYIDYLIIAFYWLLYMALAALLSQQGWFVVGVLAAVCITAAAQLDFLENLNLFTLLDSPPNAPNLEHLVAAVRKPSRFKWALIFLAVGLTALVFLPQSNWRLWTVGMTHLLTAIVGLIGIGRYRPAVEWGYGLMSLSIILDAVTFTLWSNAFIME